MPIAGAVGSSGELWPRVNRDSLVVGVARCDYSIVSRVGGSDLRRLLPDPPTGAPARLLAALALKQANPARWRAGAQQEISKTTCTLVLA